MGWDCCDEVIDIIGSIGKITTQRQTYYYLEVEVRNDYFGENKYDLLVSTSEDELNKIYIGYRYNCELMM